MTLAKSPMQIQEEEDRIKQDKEMGQIVELGRIFEKAIDNFGGVNAKVVLGACDYIIKIYKERMAAIAENYGTLKRVVEQEGIKIREPYVNDGIPARKAMN